MPNYNQILAGLSRRPLDDVFQPGRMRPPELILDSFQEQMGNELRNRAFQSARLGETDEVGALSGLIKSYAEDRANSPIGRQRELVSENEALSRKAALGGFGSPQEEAAYGRNLAERELDIREQNARANPRTALIQGNNALALERERNRGLLDLLSRSQAGDRDVSAITKTGTGGGIRFQNEQSARPMGGAAGLMGDLPNLIDYAERSKGTRNEAAAQAALDDLRQQILASRTDVDPLLREFANDLVGTGLTQQFQSFGELQQALLEARPEELGSVSPEEWAQIHELVRMLSGVR